MDPVSPPLRRGLPALVAVLVLAAFYPALGADWINYDDPVNFQRNPHYRGLGPENLKWMFTNATGHYMPLTWMTLGVDYLLWGMDARGYHVTSVLLHSLNGVLCYFFLLGVLRRRTAGAAPYWAAAAGALLYALHPLRVESVAWITERRDGVAALFFFACLLAYLKAHPPAAPVDRRWLAASAAFFLLSLLGKAIGMTLPLALLVLDACALGRFARSPDGRIPWRTPVLEKIPFFLLMGAGVAITALGQSAAGAFQPDAHSASQMIVRPGYRLSFYLGKLLLPIGLSPFYPDRPVSSLFEARYVLSTLLVVGITLVLFRLRGRHPALLGAWLAFIVLLGPVIGPFQAGPHFAADRYTCLAAVPVSLLAAAVLLRARPAAVAGTVVLLGTLGILTARQCAFWKDSEALWTHAIEVDRSSSLPFNQRGTARMARMNYAGALEDFTEAIRIDPNSPKPLTNRASVRLRTGDRAGAAADVEQVLRLDPLYPMAYEVRGGLHRMRGDFPAALQDYSRAIELDPVRVEAFVERASTFGALGMIPRALEDCRIALLLHPHHPGALINRGVLRGESGDLQGAAEDYTQALRFAPRAPEALGGRGMVRALQGRWADAVGDFEAALEAAPSDWPYRNDTLRRLEEARKALGLRP